MSNMLAIGLRGLMAFQSAMIVTGQNMTNFDTPFYSRRRVDFVESINNNGVDIADVRRIYSQFTSENLQKSTSDFAMNDVLNDQLIQLEKMLSNDKSNIGKAIKDSLKSITDLNNNASSMQSRGDYLNKLNFLAGRFNFSSAQIEQQQTGINQSLQNIVSNINQITIEIASLNQQVADAQGEDISSLLDQREAQVQELAKYLNFTTTVDSTSQISISLINGASLVLGNQSATLSAVPDPSNANQLLIEFNPPLGVNSIDITNVITSGQIAGLYDLQSTLTNAQATLNQLALTLANALNSQNKLGIDANGNWGGNIFTDINNTGLVNQRVLPNAKNTGTENMTVTIANTNQLVASDYKLVFDTSSHYILTRKSDNTIVSQGAISSFPTLINTDGFSLSLNSGSIVAGDSFIISPTADASSAMSVMLSDAKMLALAWAVDAQKGQQNTGSGAVNVDAILDPSNTAFSIPGQLNPPLTIQFLSPTSYQIVNANTNTVMEGPITYSPTSGYNSVFPTPGGYDPGYRLSLSGTIDTGDVFNIGYSSKITSDTRNGLAMEGLYQQKLLQNSTYTFTDAFNNIINTVSLDTKTAKMNFDSSKAVYMQAFKTYDAISGVEEQEESMNMERYRQGYEASAQIIQIARSVFDTILQIGR
jgi:flagellar hook-associated protein 1